MGVELLIYIMPIANCTSRLHTSHWDAPTTSGPRPAPWAFIPSLEHISANCCNITWLISQHSSVAAIPDRSSTRGELQTSSTLMSTSRQLKMAEEQPAADVAMRHSIKSRHQSPPAKKIHHHQKYCGDYAEWTCKFMAYNGTTVDQLLASTQFLDWPATTKGQNELTSRQKPQGIQTERKFEESFATWKFGIARHEHSQTTSKLPYERKKGKNKREKIERCGTKRDKCCWGSWSWATLRPPWRWRQSAWMCSHFWWHVSMDFMSCPGCHMHTSACHFTQLAQQIAEASQTICRWPWSLSWFRGWGSDNQRVLPRHYAYRASVGTVNCELDIF